MVALLAGCQANWQSPTQPQPLLKDSQTKVSVSVASPQPQRAPATQPNPEDERAVQLTQEIQEYVNNLAMDDLQAKLTRHEGRPLSSPQNLAALDIEPAEPATSAAANPQTSADHRPSNTDKIAPAVSGDSAVTASPATVTRQASHPAAPTPPVQSAQAAMHKDPAPTTPSPTARAPRPANPTSDTAITGRHIALEPELIVPGAENVLAAEPRPESCVSPTFAAADLTATRQPTHQTPAVSTGDTRAAPMAQHESSGPQVVSIDIAPAVLSTLATQPSPRAIQPQTNQPAAIRTGPSDDLKHLIDQLRKEASDRPDSIGAALRLRLAEWLLIGDTTPDEWPVQDADKQRLAQSVWQVLQVIATMEASPQGAPTEEFQKAIVSLTETLQQVQPLQIPTALLCRSVSSFGCPDTMPQPWEFPAGRTSMVVLYCELAGFKSEAVPEKDNWYHTLLSQRLAILTSAGKELWDYEDQQVEDFCRRPRRDFFITKLLKIPAELPVGDYVLKVTIRDKLANRVTETNVPFGITLAGSLANQK